MKQSDTATTLPQMNRLDSKPPCMCKKCVAKREAKLNEAKRATTFINVRLMEDDKAAHESASGVAKPSRFRVVLIREGLGNLADGYYYPGEALESAAREMLFEGKKIFANHPSSVEEQVRPERSVQEILGHFENVKLATDESGRKILEADVVILPGEPFDWARSMMQHSIDYSKRYKNQDFIGLSINASGEAIPMELDDIPNVPPGAKPKVVEAMQKGLNQVRYVKQITEAHSCDLVTQPGAGGGILKFLEAKSPSPLKEKSQMDHKEEQELKKNVKAEGQKDDECEAEKEEKKEADAQEAGEEKKDEKPAEGEEKKEEPKKDEEKEAMGSEMPADDEKKDLEKTAKDEHGDAEEDKALFRKLLKDALGKDDFDASDAEKESVKEAVSKAKKAFPDDEKEAMKAAHYGLKMAAHEAMEEAKAKEAAAKKEAEPMEAKPMESAKPKNLDAKLKEAEGQVLKLAAENARLKADLSKFEIQAHLDSKLKESKLPNVATKLFREKAGDVKSKKELDDKLALFVEAWNESGKPASFALIEAERVIPGSEAATGSISLSDCQKGE